METVTNETRNHSVTEDPESKDKDLTPIVKNPILVSVSVV